MTTFESASETDYDSAVALVGMSGRFPGADGVDALWRNLLDGVSGLRTITPDELAAAGVDATRAADPHYVDVGGPVTGLDQFDAAAFGMNPRETEAMEPQHRMFLECAWEALESAGYSPVEPGDQVGVFGGCAFPDYMIDNVSHLTTEPGGMLLFAVGNERDSLTSLVSYKLGLRGPSLTVQTFCSTSLVAVHLACQSLLTFESDIALAGGTFLPLPQPTGYLFEPGSILSPDGRVRSFDAEANGSVMGSGVGVVALKRLSDALAEGDVIHAVILGSAMNNDGREKAGYTAPGLDGQAAVIETALAVAGVKPETIGYVECHATGTQLGDSIELTAMSRVFQTVPATPCVLSSLKPSIGHLDRASGVAGLMRAALNLRHEILPGTPGFQAPNSALDTDRFVVLPENRPWPAGPEPRRAGVSSFGLGGTNAHVVLEQAPPRAPRDTRPGPHLLCFSAGDATALDEVGNRLRAHLIEHPDADLADVAFTLQVSRGHFALRRAVVVTDHADAVAALGDPARFIDGRTERRDPPVVLRGGSVDADAVRDLGVDVLDSAVDGAIELPEAATVVEILAHAWLAGSPVDWPALHEGQGRRVELPTYPFQRSRYWVDAQPRQLSTPAPTGRIDDPSRWTYLPTWIQHPTPVDDLDGRLRAAGPWLVFSDDPRGEQIVARLATAGAEVVTVRPGPAVEQDEVGDFSCDPTDPQQLGEVLQSLFVAPQTIVHALSLASPVGGGVEHFETEQERGLHAVLALVNALGEDVRTPPTDLVLVTAGAVGVLGSDLTHPEHATLSGLAPSIAQENPALTCRHVDLAGLEDIESALGAAVAEHAGPVAVRDGSVWLRHYEPTVLPETQTPLVRTGDVVLITGGLGDVGLVLARHLASTYSCRLVLTGRQPLPPRAEWDAFVAEDTRTARHIRSVRQLEAGGATVLATCADVADRAQMQAVVDAAVAEFGRIDVVVHGAGVQDPAYFGLAHLADRSVITAHLRAKVHGLLVLQEVLGDQAARQRITLSSVSAVLGGIALGPYSAANAALDAAARRGRLDGHGRWVSVDWDTWAVDAQRLDDYGGQTARDYEMAPAEGLQVFERALANVDRVAHVVVSTGPLEARLQQWVTGGAAVGEDASALDRPRHPRPAITTAYTDPADGLERCIADIWAETLALEEVGANDNFFELGGHSLIAIQLIARLRAAASSSLPVTALVEYPTVRLLAALIETSDR